MPAVSASGDIPASKQVLRAAALARRDALDAAFRQEASIAIAGRVTPLADEAVAAGFSPVSAFLSIRSEVDTAPLLVGLAESGVALSLPAVTMAGLEFRTWKPGEPLRKAGFGLSEPDADAPAVEPGLLLVPLAAFDRRGGRIGYGKGHYDTAIARLAARRPIRTIGLAFACQEVAAVPMEPHDRRLDLIVTETGAFAAGAPPGGPAR